MDDMTRKNIDDIIRKKLLEGENYVDYQEADWNALESKLDAQKKVIPWMWIFSAAAVILLVAMFSWIIWKPTNNDTRPVTQNEPSQQTQPITPEPENNRSTESQNPKPVPNTRVLLAESSKKVQPSASNAGTQKEPQISIEEHELGQVLNLAENFNSFSTSELAVYSRRAPDERETQGVKPSISLAKQRNSWNGLAVGIIASTDLNGVGSFQHSSIGGDFGFTVTAQITDRWSISTGAIYAKKPYTIAYDQYRPGSNYQPSVQPDKVHADCRVLDIPVNINYTFLRRKEDSFSIGTGISSYLMLREDYYFRYANSYNQGSNELSIVNRNRHWFGVVNLQASYERQINTGLSIGFGPYLKLPVDDIGYGRVKLRSVGLAVTVNWHVLQ